MATPGRKILLAVDASEQAEQAFDWYVKTAHRPDNELILLHVPELLDADRSRMMYLSSSAFDEAMKKENAKSKELEDKYNRKMTESGITGVIKSDGGNKPGEVICRVAEHEAATMIVIGTRGLGKIRRTMMGSVSDYVVHHAHCAVIVCRHAAH